jgi:hypothetical protein
MACILRDVSKLHIRRMSGEVPVKRAGEHQIVVTCELAHACVEFAIIDETTSLADYKEREDDPDHFSNVMMLVIEIHTYCL